jgi:hypothetical protein
MVTIGAGVGIALGATIGIGGVGDIVATDIGYGMLDSATLTDTGLGTGITGGELVSTPTLAGIGNGRIGIMSTGLLSVGGVGVGTITQSCTIWSNGVGEITTIMSTREISGPHGEVPIKDSTV